ncbi:MAG: recombinase family protein [Firmicutes bacterium]|nr:recombinase family protein [Bacillota bacterium]
MDKSAYIVAAYIRLSNDDGDFNDIKAESESVSNQRTLIKKYIKENTELCNSQYLEFIDDGYSGLNFDRPQFKKMMECAKEGSIDCIVVKDLSRFGRNHIEAGNYLEYIFPFLGIRFISINDNFDSKYAESAANIEIGFKNIMHEYYSINMGKNIKAAKEIMHKKGLYMCTYPPYGYKRSKENKYKIEIDEDSAKIVRKIFNMRISGMTYTEIAKRLNQENIPSPKVHLNMKVYNEFKNSFWNLGNVSSIVKNEVYIGNMVYHKSENIKAARGIKSVRCTPIVKENTHEAIIEKEIFYCANSIRKKSYKKRSSIVKHYLFSGKLKCKVCSHNYAVKTGKTIYYFCKSRRYLSDLECFEKYIKEDDIIRCVLDEFNKLVEKNEIKRKILNSAKKNKTDHKKIITSTEAKVERLKTKKFDLFEKYAAQTLTSEEYTKRNAEFDERIQKFENELARLRQDYKKYDHDSSSLFDEYKNIKNIDRETIDKLIDIIIVDSEGNLEIKWKF